MKRLLPCLISFSFCMVFMDNTLKAQCHAGFTYTINESQVSFASTSTGTSYLIHSWHFGDGTLKNMQANPVHTYNMPGQYAVMLVVRDTVNNCVDSVIQTLALNFTPTCSVNFTYTRPSYFSSQYDFYSQIAIHGSTFQSINWTINGTPVSTSATFSHTFTQAGNYSVCVNMQTVSGCTSQKCNTINYTPYNNCSGNASFTATPDPVQTRQIQFSAQPSLAGAKYSWQFGDGQSGYGQTTTHTYSYAGSYHVTLFIADTINHCYDSLSQVTQVTLPPIETCTASLSYSTSGSSPGQLSLTASSNQTITSYLWTLSTFYNPVSMLTSSLAAPVFTIPDSGYYRVCLQLITNTGCTIQTCDSLVLGRTSGRTQSNQVLSYPNPATGDEISFQLAVDQSSSLIVRIYSSQGVLIKTVKDGRPAGTGVITIPVGGLQSGQYYFIEFQNGNTIKRSKFLKL